LITLEEAWVPQSLAPLFIEPPPGSAPPGVSPAQFQSNFVDIHNQRLTAMDDLGISYMVLSLVSPGPQGISDPTQAQQVAVSANNELAAAIANNTERFGAFAALAMHNATVASEELRRAVTELGFLGALINDYQQSGEDNSTLLYYDQPEYDPFWETVQELDVPVYLHPRTPVAAIDDLEYNGRHWLIGATWQFAAGTSNHALGLCVNGVFDRFPNVTVILGHMGERIPSDLFRVDQQLARQTPPMLKTIREYYQTNLISTAAAEFANPLLDFHIAEIGAERIMFSIDYPFQSLEDGVNWFNGIQVSERDNELVKNQVAIDALRLNR